MYLFEPDLNPKERAVLNSGAFMEADADFRGAYSA